MWGLEQQEERDDYDLHIFSWYIEQHVRGRDSQNDFCKGSSINDVTDIGGGGINYFVVTVLKSE